MTFSEDILPPEMIENEVQLIKNLGVTIKTETMVGKDISIGNLKDAFDAILLATGQPKDTESARENIQLGESGHIDINLSTHETNFLGVFVAGDIHMPGSPAEVIAEAKHAAETIDKYLKGKGLYLGKEIEIPEPQLSYGIWDITPEEGLTSSPTKEGAKKEALRCLRCDRNSIKSR
jgi:NADPH-dependent glutamate synthase beta subunit-like oxidoreductase